MPRRYRLPIAVFDSNPLQLESLSGRHELPASITARFAMRAMFIALLLGGAYVVHRAFFWKAQGTRVLKPGYLTPRPSLTARFVRWVFSLSFKFLYVGPVRIIGAHNLKYPGRIIALGNHQNERDSVLSISLVGLRPARYFIAANQVTAARAPVVAISGGITVDDQHPHGPVAALAAAIKVLIKEDDSSFVIFQQGRLVRSNELKREDFFPGAALIGRKVGERSDASVSYLPFGVFFDRNPDHASPFHRLMNRLGWKNFRMIYGEITYRAVIVVGEPIPVLAMPRSPEKATDVLFERIVELSQRAAAAAGEFKPTFA
jgi:1-acyl-sn-glycerol-3-phosphate acyltransferase